MANKKDTGKNTGKKAEESRVSPILIGLVILIGLILAFVMLSDRNTAKKPADGKDATSNEPPVYVDPDTALQNLGTAIVIGKKLESRKLDGTTLVPPEKIPGLETVLESTDVSALERLMRKNNIPRLVVDPSIVVRNPIPKNTVRNRLALAHPAGRLSAVTLTREFFVYELGKGAPPLTKEDKQALMQLVRAAANVPGATRPQNIPKILQKIDDWRMILTVRPVQNRHLSLHIVNTDTLENGAAALAKKIAAYYERKGFERKFGPLAEALTDQITLELEIVYDRGTYIGPRDNIFMWRIIEPGIYGAGINVDGRNHRLPPWYAMTTNLRTVASIMERISKRMAGQDKDYWKRPEVPIERFRTVHWRESRPGGDIIELYRSNPRVPSPKDITKESMKASLDGLTHWLAYNHDQYSDDRMIYRYYPSTDNENSEYNMVRHALGTFSMALGAEFNNDPKYKETADACLRWIEERTRWGGAPVKDNGDIDNSVNTWQGKSLPGEDIAIFDADENIYDTTKAPSFGNKMGAVAVAILGYTQYRKVGWELGPEREKFLDGFANFLLYMQKEDGSFHHYYVANQNRYYGTRNSIYPGEILYAVARLYGETKDERYKVAFKRSMEANLSWFKREMEQKEPDGTYAEERRKELVQFQPWIAMSMEEMYRYDPDPAYLEASNLVSLWILDTYQFNEERSFYPDYVGGYLKVLDELPAMHTFVYTEGTAASYVLARQAGASPEVIQKLRRGALLSARFILQQQIRTGENDWYYPNPKRAFGGVKYCINHNKQRIDYTYHALSSVYRILHAATPEDYAFVQSLSVPETW